MNKDNEVAKELRRSTRLNKGVKPKRYGYDKNVWRENVSICEE